MSNVVTEVRVACASDVCSLWNVMTDTERMNRAVGMAPVQFTPLKNDPSAARYLARTKLGGFNLQYEERPYEWVYLKYFRVYRRMRNGPVRGLEIDYSFAPAPDGKTEVHVRITLEPRLGILAPFVRLNSALNLRRFEREIKRVDGELVKSGVNGCLDGLQGRKSELDRDALARAEKELLKITTERAAAERLLAHVREGGDFDLSRIRPFALADRWSEPRRAILVACLEGVQAGLLDLRWDIVCPSCRTASSSLPSLSAIEGHGTCQLCDIQFGLDVDEAVEATFIPAARIRPVDEGPYCIGGPARTPHVLMQSVLPAGGSVTLSAPTEPGAYRLFVRGGKSLRLDLEATGENKLQLSDGDGEWPARAKLAVGGAIEIAHAGAGDTHVKLERMMWTHQSATARELTALPIFRRAFSADVLRPNVTLKVSRVALLFSDLTGSTRLYSRAGDAAAFRLVHDHFDVLVSLIEKHGGTLVKTIGDAVMAAFADELDGIAASQAILDAFAAFRASDELRQQTDIKLGVFAGPCYVVTANGILDYFGQTVNIAARLQAQAKSGQLVVEQKLAEEAIARGLIKSAQVVEKYDAKLKGVDGPIGVARVARSGSTVPAAIAPPSVSEEDVA